MEGEGQVLLYNILKFSLQVIIFIPFEFPCEKFLSLILFAVVVPQQPILHLPFPPFCNTKQTKYQMVSD